MSPVFLMQTWAKNFHKFKRSYFQSPLPSHLMFPYWLAHCCGGPCLSSLSPCGRFGQLLALVSSCPNRVMRDSPERQLNILHCYLITETTAIENCRGAPYKTVIFILLISECDHHKQKRNLQETLESELLGRLNDLKLCFLCYVRRKISDKTRANWAPADIGRALVGTV